MIHKHIEQSEEAQEKTYLIELKRKNPVSSLTDLDEIGERTGFSRGLEPSALRS